MSRLKVEFYKSDVLEVAPNLLGKYLILLNKGKSSKYMITEVEAYRGVEDLACHASKGRTKRTEVMYHEGGSLYIYLIYGMYWMLNVVTGDLNVPQAVLVRGIQGCVGPGRLTKKLNIDKTYYGENLVDSKRIWIEDSELNPKYITTPRIGIDYAGEIWKNKPWRFLIQE